MELCVVSHVTKYREKMGRERIIVTLFIYIISTLSAYTQTSLDKVILSGSIRDAQTKEILPYATVQIKGIKNYATVADDEGNFKITGIQPGEYDIYFSYIGYKKQKKHLELKKNLYLTVNIYSSNQLHEVVVTATEARGPVTASIIDRSAMSHLQPTSFTDLLELLPGGISKDPNMGAANTINLRETGTTDANGNATNNPDYAITSLGTLFVVDGAPINTDANLQYSPLSNTYSSGDNNNAENKRNITNRGVDMRAISTDDIESVEIIRGIPSVEYGNLTSGVVNIKKIRKATPLAARFKADGYSKLVAVGKGFIVPGNQDLIVNLDGGYLNSKVDPTNKLENYQRINASIRLTWNWKKERWVMRWASAFDYTGSFDNSKQDPELNFGRIDEYKSVYNRSAFTNNLEWKFPKLSFLKLVELNSAVSMQVDRLTQTRLVSPQRYGLAPTSTDAGEHDAQILFSEYMADYLSEGKPFNTYVKLKSEFNVNPAGVRNNIKVGGQWDYTKNYGRGQVYDLGHPLSAVGDWDSRPRAYKDIPAIQNLSFFLEDMITKNFWKNKLELLAGVRTNSLLGLDEAYLLKGKVYLDPRFNAQWTFPGIKIGKHDLVFALAGGIGWTTKMPTLNYLYPDKRYNDITQLAYYDDKKPVENSRFTVLSYIQDQTNYNLKPARNKKWEVRTDISYNGNRLSVSYFREITSSGFRYSNVYAPYSYKDYDESSIISSELQGPPILENIPYSEKSKLDYYRRAENGSRLEKEGVEFQFTSQRIKPLRTAMNITGAWFKSVYTNSLPMYYAVSDVVDNVIVQDNYIGLYNWNDGQINHRFNTNFMLDTQVPEWGLIFTSSVQCVWYTQRQLQRKNGIPVSYIDVSDGELHPYTEESKSDAILQHLILNYNEDNFRPMKIPMALYVNFKATKRIGKHLSLAFFANKLLDYTPDYQSNGFTIRRNVDPYFGMELNFTL